MKLEPGDLAPAFRLVDDGGETVRNEDLAGHKHVIYFYPKAFTPGCTTESCDFRDRHESFTARGYDIIGVSPDAPADLARFRAEHRLPFRLLSDPDHEMTEAYGAWGVKKNYGREYEGVIRSTIAIAADGTVEQAWYNVRAAGHADRIAERLGASQ